MNNPFFKNNGPFLLDDLLKVININSEQNNKQIKIIDIKDLSTATKDNITFFHSKKYETLASKTNASVCITSESLSHILPNNCKPLIVENVLIALAKITRLFYPESILDNFDQNVENIANTLFVKNVIFGKNVLIGKNVSIGKNFSVGHNSIIESNVVIGDNCSVGSNVIIRNTVIKNNVTILDGCIVGKKGFGFFPDNEKNIRYPHIGIVMIEDNCEIGCGSTIDRGSLSNTIIGKNTFIDNQVHIAHNNKIGNNCIVAGQVGFAGSSTLGNNVMIGGQAGISGHLNIGNNVHIGGGSGVIKDIANNKKVMGYPAKDLKNFIKDNK